MATVFSEQSLRFTDQRIICHLSSQTEYIMLIFETFFRMFSEKSSEISLKKFIDERIIYQLSSQTESMMVIFEHSLESFSEQYISYHLSLANRA